MSVEKPLEQKDQHDSPAVGTVLFAEVIGEPGDELVQVVATHRGQVIKSSIGQSFAGPLPKRVVVGYWPDSPREESGPESAVHAALELRSFYPVGPQPGEVHRSIRIGVHAGSFIQVGHQVHGESIELARLLAQSALPGSILVSRTIFREVQALVSMEPFLSDAFPGRSDATQAYLVRHMRAYPSPIQIIRRSVQGIETAMIGRNEPLTHLQNAYNAMLGEHRLQMVTVSGETGIGKSRLLYEFDHWIDFRKEQVWYFKGRANPEMRGEPYSLLREMFAFRFGIRDTDPPDRVRLKFEHGIISGGGRLEDSAVARISDEGSNASLQLMRAHFIGHLVGFNFSESPHIKNLLKNAQQIRDRGQVYMTDYFRALAQEGPVLLEFEDLHWADDSSLDLISHLTLSLAYRQVMLVCTTRPTLYKRRPGWGKKHAFQSRIHLSPLSIEDSQRLIQEILKRAQDIPEQLREYIIEEAEGNPFYLEELIKMLIDDGVIDTHGDEWSVKSARLEEHLLPASLTQVLQARFAALLPVEKEVLQQAAVIGRVFWDSAISFLARPSEVSSPDRDIGPVLQALCKCEMIFPRSPSTIKDADEYMFKHVLLRKVVYESLPRADRKNYHALVAEWLIVNSGKRAGEFAGLVAMHLEHAGESGRALHYLKLAGEQAADRYANIEAVDYFTRALAITPETDLETRWDLLLDRDKVLDLLGRREDQNQNVAALEKIALDLGDPACQAMAALRRSAYADATSDYPAKAAAARFAIEKARLAGTSSLEAEGFWSLGVTFTRLADYPAAREKLEQGLYLARRSPAHDARSRQVEAGCLVGLGSVFWLQGNYLAALNHYEKALFMWREIGDRYGEGITLNSLGTICRNQNDFVRAQTCCEQSLSINREIGDRFGEGIALSNLGIVYSSQGDYARAREYYEQSLEINREIGNRRGESGVLQSLGIVSFMQGDLESAREFYQHSQSIFQDIGDRRMQGYTLTGLCDVYTRLSLWAEAEKVGQQALDIRIALGQQHLAMETHSALARLAIATGELDTAYMHVKEIVRFLDGGGVLDGTINPFWIRLTCWKFLSSRFQPEDQADAHRMLVSAYQLLEKRVAQMDEAFRRMYLDNVPWHKEIVAQWQALSLKKPPR